MTKCLNLREQFGSEFRIRFEPAYHAEHGSRAWRDDPWLQIVPGAKGHIYPHGGELLAVATNTRGPTAKRLLAIPGVAVIQDGSDGINATFQVERFNEVAEVIQARKRRKGPAPDKLANFIAAGAAYRFSRGDSVREIELESTIGS